MTIEQLKLSLISSFRGIEFNEDNHSYKYKGIDLVSATTFIERYTQPFNSWSIATAMAKRYNQIHPSRPKRDASYYINRWKQINDASKANGSRVHNYVEYNYPIFHDPPTCLQELAIIEFFENLDDKYEVLCLELRMHMSQYFRSGTTDLILYNKETEKLVVADWKTNQKNITQYYKNKTLNKPFDDLYDTSLNLYSLQLSDYKNMVEITAGLPVEECWVIHLSTNDWRELDLSKRDHGSFFVDEVQPDYEGEYYRIYKVKDYSKILVSEYENFVKKMNPKIILKDV